MKNVDPQKLPSGMTKNSQGESAPRRSFMSNLVAVLGGQLSCAVVGLAIQVCYARLLGPAGRGQISVCLMAIALGVLVGGMGGEYPMVLWTAGSREKSREWLPGVIGTGILGSIVASFLWAVVFWAWHPAFLKGMTSPMAILVLFSIPVSVSVSYLMSALTGFESFRLRAGLALANQVLGLAGVLGLVLIYGPNPEVAVLGNQLGLLICAGVTVYLLKDFLRDGWNLSAVRQRIYPVVNLGFRGQLGNLATFFNYRLDVFIVNYYLDSAQVGLYAVGVLVTEALWQIPNAAGLALLPRTARTLNEGAAEFTCFVLRQVLLVACVSGVALALLSPAVIPLVFGAQFSPSVAVIWWLLPGVIALSLAKVICADLAARGRPEFSSIFAFASLVVTVVLDLALIPRMGIKGASIASSAAYVADALLLAIALKHLLRVPWKSFLLPTQADGAAYQMIWFQCKAWLRPAAVPLGPGRLD
jgi:O-antigen/teichoic acid export membrane protein